MAKPRNTVEIDDSWLNKLHAGLTYEAYNERVGINASGLKDILRSPGHYRYFSIEPQAPTPAMLFGTYVHMAVLEPRLWAQNVAVAGNKMAVVQRDPADAKAGYVHVMPRATFDRVNTVRDAVLANPKARKLLAASVVEQCLWWRDPYDDIICKARVDAVSSLYKGKPVCIDLKTTSDGCHEAFSRQAWQKQYAMQAAHYCAGGAQTGLYASDAFIFIVVETTAPYACTVYHADPRLLDLGALWRQHAVEVYADCRKSQRWLIPAEDTLQPPPWAKQPGWQDTAELDAPPPSGDG